MCLFGHCIYSGIVAQCCNDCPATYNSAWLLAFPEAQKRKGTDRGLEKPKWLTNDVHVNKATVHGKCHQFNAAMRGPDL